MAETHELSINRLIAASPDKVWDVLADRTSEWWCPAPWRAEVDWASAAPVRRSTPSCLGQTVKCISIPA